MVPIRDMVLPANSHFVKLVGRMKQTVKFKPNDSFRFSVYLADGTLFLPMQQDLQPFHCVVYKYKGKLIKSLQLTAKERSLRHIL